MLADTYQPALTFASLVLVDPMLLRKTKPGEPVLDLGAGSAKRRDIWPSRAEALRSLQSRPSFQVWDPRILEIYVVSISARLAPKSVGLSLIFMNKVCGTSPRPCTPTSRKASR